jgi:hypothetical protein
MQRKAPELGTSCHMGPTGKPEGVSFTGEFVRQTKQDYGSGVSCMRALREEPEGRVPLLGTLKDMQRKALEMDISHHIGPLEGPCLLGTWRHM